jgi:glycosyltransferase involved in cell wall biosynthesis
LAKDLSLAVSTDISVLMSVFNGEVYLRESIKSILEQEFRSFEFIIVNDGSTDQSVSVIRSFSDPRIIEIDNEKNLGLIESLNRGLAKATGKYIVRMDADDIAARNRLSELFDYMEKNPSVVVAGSDYYNIGKNITGLVKNIDNSDFQKSILLFSPCFCHPTVAIRSAHTALRYKDEYKHAEDFKLWTDLATSGEFGNVNKPLLKYRSHGTQVSTANREHQRSVSQRIREEYLKQLGFEFTLPQIKIHHAVADNTFITSEILLSQIESWLLELSRQNKEKKILDAIQFDKVMFKFWKDSCGNANLGLRAYRMFGESPVSEMAKIGVKEKLKLAAKCMIRFFRKK